jgi:PII-like signaling protein
VSEDCLKLTTYFGERDRTAGRLLADELLRLYGERRLQASVLLRGAEGFGRGGRLRTDRLLSLSEDLPVVSIAIDSAGEIEDAIEPVLALKRKGLVTLERARLIGGRSESGGRPGLSRPLDPGGPLDSGEALGRPAEGSKLTLHLGRQDRIGSEPAFVAVCELLRGLGLDGATVLLGVDGTRRGRRERARLLSRNAEVPTMIVAVGAASEVAAALPALERILPDPPLATLECVRICKRDGALLAAPHELPGVDEHGRPLFQKLTVYSSHSAVSGGYPLHLAIVRRLRETGAAGATCVRGVWGFHGDHEPHGEALLRLRRTVPVVTIAIDSPERIARSFGAIDELTDAHGLVTSEIVPALSEVGAGGPHGSRLRLARHAF